MKTINFKPEPRYQTRHGPVPVHGPGVGDRWATLHLYNVSNCKLFSLWNIANFATAAAQFFSFS